MVLPSVVVPVGDGGQVGRLKVALTRIHCCNISQGIAPDLQKIHTNQPIQIRAVIKGLGI